MRKGTVTAGVLSWIVMLSTVCLWAEDYYVDAVHGADTNAGTSPETAWKTANRVSLAQELAPGDTVHFRAGQVWRESLTVHDGEPGKPITYTSYGEGAKPSFWSSLDLCHEENWQPGPKEHVWCTRPLRIVREEGKLDSFASGKWSLHCDGDGQATLEQSQSEAGNPILKVTCEKSGQRASNVQLNNAAFPLDSLQGIRFRFRARASKPFVLGQPALIMAGHPWDARGKVLKLEPLNLTETWQDFEVWFQTLAFPDCKDGRLTFFVGHAIPEGCVFEVEPLGAERIQFSDDTPLWEVGNIVLRKQGSTLPKKDDEFAAWKRWNLDSLKGQGDFFYDRQTQTLFFYSEQHPVQVYSQIEAAMKRYTFGVSPHHDFVLDGLEARYASGHGAAGANIRHAVFRNCDFCWIGGSWLYDDANGNPVRYGNGIELWDGAEDVLVDHCYFFQVYDTATTNQGPGERPWKNITWQYNKMERCEQAYEIWNSLPTSYIENIRFEYNECIDSGFGWSHEQRPDKTATHILAYGMGGFKQDVHYRHNTFGNSRGAMFWYFNPKLPEIDIDENTYSVPEPDGDVSRKMFRWGGRNSEQVSFREFQEKYGKDQHSTWTNGPAETAK